MTKFLICAILTVIIPGIWVGYTYFSDRSIVREKLQIREEVNELIHNLGRKSLKAASWDPPSNEEPSRLVDIKTRIKNLRREFDNREPSLFYHEGNELLDRIFFREMAQYDRLSSTWPQNTP